MFTQKLYKTGNSVAVTIPKEYLNNLNLKEGAEVMVEQDPDSGVIIITHKRKVKSSPKISPEFLKWLDSFNRKYGSALKELAKK